MSKSEDRTKLSFADAAAMLPDGDEIHTFVNPNNGMLIGADWDRESVLDLLKNGSPELSGDMATGMGHGIVAWRKVDKANDKVSEPIFVATKEAEKT